MPAGGVGAVGFEALSLQKSASGPQKTLKKAPPGGPLA
jgi:hypothetical protein